MAPADTSRLALRFLALAPVPPVLGFGVPWLFWWLFYLSIPIFFPFLAYEYSCSTIGIRGAPTLFHGYGWYWSAAYLVLVVAGTAVLTFRQSYIVSLAALLLITAVFGLLTHLVLNALGFCYWLDTP
jgi:hypothetical protein